MTKFVGWLLALAVALSAASYLVVRLNKTHDEIVSVLLPWAVPPQAPPRPKLIATYRDLPPELVVYSPGRHAGPLRMIIEEAADRIGYDVEWKAASFADGLTALSEGTADIVPSALFKTPEREKLMRFSVSLGRIPYIISFMQRTDSNQPIKKLDDLKGRTVGYRSSVLYFDEFDSLSGFKRVMFSNDIDMMKAFADRVVDVVVVNNKRAAERAQISSGINSGNYKYGDMTITQEVDLYMLYSLKPERQPIFDQLDQALLKMKNDNLLVDIYKSFNVPPPQAGAASGTRVVTPPPLPAESELSEEVERARTKAMRGVPSDAL